MGRARFRSSATKGSSIKQNIRIKRKRNAQCWALRASIRRQLPRRLLLFPIPRQTQTRLQHAAHVPACSALNNPMNLLAAYFTIPAKLFRQGYARRLKHIAIRPALCAPTSCSRGWRDTMAILSRQSLPPVSPDSSNRQLQPPKNVPSYR